MEKNNKFPSGISKYGYKMYGKRHMLYIEFFENSLGGNSPAETDIISGGNSDYNIDNPDNLMYEACGFAIRKIEDIITHKTINRLGNFIVGIVHKCNDGFINYYTTYQAAINNSLSLDMYKYLYPSGITEYRKIYNNCGELYEEYLHINGQIQGEKKCYRYNNSISSIELYVDGKLHGISKYYYDTPAEKIFIELYSVNGLEYGEEKIFNKKGDLLFTNYYKNGFYDGIVQKYSVYDNKLISITTYKNGKKDGLCKEFSDDGKIKKSYYYKNGKKHGLYTIYCQNSLSKKKYKLFIQYEDGNKQGFMYRYVDNKIIHLNKYINNRIIGYSFYFEDDNDIFNENKYIDFRKGYSYSHNKYNVNVKNILNYDGKYNENIKKCCYYCYYDTKLISVRLEIERLFNDLIKSIKNIFKIHYNFMTENNIRYIIENKLN